MGSGLGSPVLAGPWVVITAKQLQFWGWTRLSPDFLAFYVSPVEQADGRTVWVWGDQHCSHGSDEQEALPIGCPPWGAELLPAPVGAHPIEDAAGAVRGCSHELCYTRENIAVGVRTCLFLRCAYRLSCRSPSVPAVALVLS